MVSREIRWTIATTEDKLEVLFNETLKIAAIFPFSGLKTDIADARIQIVRGFKIVYRVRDRYLEVFKVWSTRNDSNDFSLE